MASGWRANRRPTNFIAMIREQSDEHMRRVIMRMFQQIVTSSPVDTGAFRGNHRIGVNGMQAGSLDIIDLSGASTISKAQRDLLQAKLGDRVYIYNNLPYAIPLERGHSMQAPLGIYSIALLNALRAGNG